VRSLGRAVRLQLQGKVAAEALVSQIHRGDRGRPANPQTIMACGRWVDGPTLRQKGAAGLAGAAPFRAPA